MTKKFIGGFFELDKTKLPSGETSVWDTWTKNTSCAITFKNARSALFYLLQKKNKGTIWLPSYVCDTIYPASSPCRYFPSDPLNGPDISLLGRELKAGDSVVLVNYFGKYPTKSVTNFIKSRRDILWVEDRSQTLWSTETSYADWLVYSPRKLMGVSDGGILVSHTHSLDEPSYEPLTPSSISAAQMRLDDIDGTKNKAWYSAYREEERNMEFCLQPMSPISRNILNQLSLMKMAEKRIKNAIFLSRKLNSINSVNTLPLAEFPFCVSTMVKNSSKVSQELAKHGVFCAQHWSNLASNKNDFPDNYKLSEKLLSLPCDHRYNIEDMQRILDCIEQAL